LPRLLRSIQEAEEAAAAKAEADRLEAERMAAEEEARVKAEEEANKKKKRKGLGGLSAEKKKMLKTLILKKAAEAMREEAKAKQAAREKHINERVPLIAPESAKDDAELQALLKDLHAKVSALEEDVYDWEIKIRKQDFEINELTLKVNDTKGKFIKPVLRKVNKTESKLKKVMQSKESTDFRGNLKSTGQNKYALDDEEGAAPQEE